MFLIYSFPPSDQKSRQVFVVSNSNSKQVVLFSVFWSFFFNLRSVFAKNSFTTRVYVNQTWIPFSRLIRPCVSCCVFSLGTFFFFQFGRVFPSPAVWSDLDIFAEVIYWFRFCQQTDYLFDSYDCFFGSSLLLIVLTFRSKCYFYLLIDSWVI